MKLSSARDLSGLRPVLKDPDSDGPNPAYWVFSEVSKETWANVTVIVPGSYNGEYPKTYGHYHPVDAPNETYHLIEGKGILMMQKKFLEAGRWIPEKVEKVYFIQVKPGEEVIIKPEWGHSWSNVGENPILTYDDWRSGHTDADYKEITDLKGMAYYLMNEGGEVKAVPNPNYVDLPEPRFVSPEEFKELEG